MRFYAGLARKGLPTGLAGVLRPTPVNGLPGFVLTEPDGSVQTIALEFSGDLVSAVYVVSNPEKLGHLTTPGGSTIRQEIRPA